MKNIFALAAILLLISSSVFGWGKTGHRVVGQVAYNHLSNKAKGNIHHLLKHEHLNMIGNHMDFVRADNTYNHMAPWHYCTVPDGEPYDIATANGKGDAASTIERLIKELKARDFSTETEIEKVKYLVHLVADLHQPLHVGNGEDLGGNDVKVEFMWEKSNLHRVWDSGLVDHQQLSFTEYSKWVDHVSESNLAQWQKEGTDVWITEALGYREAIYTLPDNKKIGWGYNYAHIATVNERLLKAGIRLAGILNEIYG